jgi:GNAT superfamily N-acetyltransferase
MNCQIIHDSIHSRSGWSKEFLFQANGIRLGYGSLAVGGPWREKPTIYEFFVLKPYRSQIFESFESLITSSKATSVETQSNDQLLTVMLHAYAKDVSSESILFHDQQMTSLGVPSAEFRPTRPEEIEQVIQLQLDPEAKWLVLVEGNIAAAGDILFHYNRPYGDIYMRVAEAFRRRGIGSYLVQELKRVCYEGGSIPAARCNPDNLASRKTLLKAGFIPCGHILHGTIEGKL